jgi:hypothetical protein
MRLPAISGVIDRRILANYRVDPDCMAAALPRPFRPQLVDGYAIGGICLIRLKRVRPKLLPIPWGIGSENAILGPANEVSLMSRTIHQSERKAPVLCDSCRGLTPFFIGLSPI